MAVGLSNNNEQSIPRPAQAVSRNTAPSLFSEVDEPLVPNGHGSALGWIQRIGYATIRRKGERVAPLVEFMWSSHNGHAFSRPSPQICRSPLVCPVFLREGRTWVVAKLYCFTREGARMGPFWRRRGRGRGRVRQALHRLKTSAGPQRKPISWALFSRR